MTPSLHTRVFLAVVDKGALTTRRLIRDFGPKPNWEPLLTHNYLVEKRTVYGPVITATRKGRAYFEENRKRRAPYIGSAGHMADRAYLMDAVEALEQLGYVLDRHIYKPAGAVGSAARNGDAHSSRIIQTVMQVPDQELSRLQYEWRVDDIRNPHKMDRNGHWGEAVGYPRLYATISHGGISPAGIHALLKKHRRDLDIWHAPLIIATPREMELRSRVRSINSQHRLQLEKIYKHPSITPKPINDLVMLISLTNPEIVRAL